MQARCIAKYRVTREELLNRKAQLEKLIGQDFVVNKGQEKAYIKE